MSDTVATFLHFIVEAPQMAVIFVVIVISAIFTEFTSNFACAIIHFPILDSVVRNMFILS
jgi:di/tricarboxylate transporter